ncbi:MAG TPA: hypothetical protein VFA09_24935 [Ktedonobacteraceae bacterium]|nr:hypothetical protein [Ktedonobacteraceae bacterium]
MLRDVLREPWTYQEEAEQEEPTGTLRLGYQQAFLQGVQQAQKELLQELRQILLKIVRLRFPVAIRLVKKQIAGIEDASILRDLVIKMSIAQSIEEAVMLLLEVDEDEGEDE